MGRKLKNLKGYTKKKDKITSQYKAKDSTIRYIFVSKGCYWFVGLNHEFFMIDFDKWIYQTKSRKLIKKLILGQDKVKVKLRFSAPRAGIAEIEQN